VRGPGDGAGHALVPVVVAASGVTLERATGLQGAGERLASTLGAAAAGALVAAVGPAPALAVDALSFGASALLLVVTVPSGSSTPSTAGEEADTATYLGRLREGWDFLRREPVLLAMTLMVALTNLLDAAFSTVLVPVWARETGGGAAVVGLWFGSFSAAAVVGSLVASVYADRLPRYPVYVGAFLLAGPPRFLLLAVDREVGLGLGLVLAVTVVAGLGCGFINPVLGAVLFERIPPTLTGRVTALEGAVCWSLLPFGGLLGGLVVDRAGLTPALLAIGAAYLVATLTPLAVPAWRTLDDTRPGRSGPSRSGEGGEPDRDLAVGGLGGVGAVDEVLAVRE
jgi:predicted MFS family arabinose efflux permease